MATLGLGGGSSGHNPHLTVEHLNLLAYWIEEDVDQFDDEWIDNPLFDHNTILVFWHLRKNEPDDEEDDWFIPFAEDDYPVTGIGDEQYADVEPDVDDDWLLDKLFDTPTVQPDFIIVLDEDLTEVIDEDDDWFKDPTVDVDLVYSILDEQTVDDDEDDHFVYRQDDLVFDIDHIVTILDDQIDYVEPDADDDYTYARQDQDLVTDFDHVVIILDDQIDDYPLDTDDDWYLDRQLDPSTVSDTGETILSLYDFDLDPDQEEDDWVPLRLDDQVYDIDHVVIVLDDQIDYIEPDQDDDLIYRLDDEVYDTDQVRVLDEGDYDLDPDDDDWIQSDNGALSDLTTILVYWHLIRNEPDDEDDDSIVIVIEQPPAVDTGETILCFYELDIDPDAEEDDWYYSYGQTDEPPFIFSGKQLFEEYKPPKVVKIDSTNIDTIAFDNRTQQLKVKFKSGHTYKYHNVSEKSAKGIKRAKSAGTYFHKNIKGKYLGHKS